MAGRWRALDVVDLGRAMDMADRGQALDVVDMGRALDVEAEEVLAVVVNKNREDLS